MWNISPFGLSFVNWWLNWSCQTSFQLNCLFVFFSFFKCLKLTERKRSCMHALFLVSLVNACFILLLLSVVWRYSTEQFSRSVYFDLSDSSLLVHFLVGFVMHVSMTIKSVQSLHRRKGKESIHQINKSSRISVNKNTIQGFQWLIARPSYDHLLSL